MPLGVGFWACSTTYAQSCEARSGRPIAACARARMRRARIVGVARSSRPLRNDRCAAALDRRARAREAPARRTNRRGSSRCPCAARPRSLRGSSRLRSRPDREGTRPSSGSSDAFSGAGSSRSLGTACRGRTFRARPMGMRSRSYETYSVSELIETTAQPRVRPRCRALRASCRPGRRGLRSRCARRSHARLVLLDRSSQIPE